jgi:hypothetical protein
MKTMTEGELQAMIDALPGEKVTAGYMDERIEKIDFAYLPGTTLTICTVQLDNGCVVIGESACVDPENYNKDIGDQLALRNAKNKLWPLFGFLLAEVRYQRVNKEAGSSDIGQE